MNKDKTLIRCLGFLLVGILIALVFTITPGTYSLYRKEYNGPNTAVEAAETKDFIKEIKIDYKEKVPYLKLKRGDDIDYAPVIFFSIEGELKNYILHMDSVKLDNELSIPIVPNVNLPQAISLILSPKNEIVGKVKIKHLNDFINEGLEVRIPKDYLLERYFLNMGHENFKMSSLSSREKGEMDKFVKEMILYTRPYMDWEEVLWEENEYRLQDNERISLPVGKVDISSNQVSLIDLIAPDLLNYNKRLYSLLEIMVKDLNNQIDENNNLKREKQELSNKVTDLEGIVVQLKDEINKLKVGNEELYNQRVKLNADNEDLYNEIRNLRTDNEELYEYIKYLEDKTRENFKTPEE